jgi:hypothetical protein
MIRTDLMLFAGMLIMVSVVLMTHEQGPLIGLLTGLASLVACILTALLVLKGSR